MKNTLLSLLFFSSSVFTSLVYGQTLIMTPANGHYCQGTAGVQISLTTTAVGTSYTLRRQTPPAANLATITGNGGAMAFPGLYPGTGSGITYVLSVPPTNSVTVFMDPIPAAYTLAATNNGVFCNYPSATGIDLWIPVSQNGVEYVLFRGAIRIDTLQGNGGFLAFGMYTTPGIYRVTARFPGTGCSRTSNNITIVASALPVANFTFSISNPCSSFPVSFQSTSTGTGLKFKWDFNDTISGTRNSDTTANPMHVFEAWGNATQTFQVKLKVTNANGCVDSIIHSVTVTQKPDATLLETLHLQNPNYPNTFAACDATSTNTNGDFEFVNGSTTQATNTWYNIVWGEATLPPFSQATFSSSIPVTYATLGYDMLVYTVNGLNGCNNTREYNVFVGNFAGGGLGNPGLLAGVAEYCIDFTIQNNSYDNPPDTRFIFNWGDGTGDTLLRQELPPSKLLTHCYNICSTTLTGNPQSYAFLATCYTENPCGAAQTTVFPIVISCPAEGEFGAIASGTLGANLLFGGNGSDTVVGCNDVTFTNTTQEGFYIIPPAYNSYTTNTVYAWDFGDPASGANNTSSLPTPTHHFTQSNMWYSVRLIAFTGLNSSFNSGRDTVIHQIYIQTPPVADYTISVSDTCLPVQAQLNDQSETGGWGVPEYRWRITPSTGWSNITPGFEGDSTYIAPLFEFNVAGNYTIKLLVENSCGVSEKDTNVLVCELPEITFADDDIYLCGPGQYSFGPAYDMNCDSATVSYLWHVTPNTYTFTGGTSATSKYPEINFNDFSDYQVTAKIINSCGVDSAIQNVHISALITNNLISPNTPLSGELCAGQAPIVIGGTLPAGGIGSYTYQWQENLNCDISPTGTWTNITVGGTLQNYTLMSPLAATRCFRRITYDAGDCSSISNVAQVLVYPVISNNVIAAGQQICNNTAPALLTGTQAFGGSGSPTYQWEQSADGIIFTSLTGATGQDYQPVVLSTSTYFRRVAISDPCPSDYSTAVLITVCNPILNNTISSGQLICQGTVPVALAGTTPTGACDIHSYQWQSSNSATYPVFTDITGITTSGYQPPVINSQTFFRRIVSTIVGNCSVSNSNEISIDIMPRPVALAGIDQTISNGATANLSGSASGGTPSYSYQWTPSTLIQAPSNVSNVTTVNLNSNTEFTLTVTDANLCTGTDRMWVIVTGNPLSSSLTANPSTLCPDDLSQLCATASGGSGNYTYTWTSPGNIYPSASCINVNPASTTTYACVVWDGFVSVSTDVTILVVPVPVITSPLSVEICSGDQLNYSPASTVGGSTYIWTSISSANCSGNTNLPLPGGTIIEDYLSNSGDDDCVISYLITPRGPAPTYCMGQTVTLDVHVKPVAQITNTVLSQTVVAGFPTAPVTFTSNVTGANIRWEYINSNCPAFASPQLLGDFDPLLPSQIITLQPGAPSTCTLTYSVRAYVLTLTGDTCWGNPYNYNYIVNSEPNKYDLICPLPVCSGQSAVVSLSNSDLGVEYRLYRGGTFVAPMLIGTGTQLDWTGISLAGSYTIIATNPGNGQSALMNGMCQVVINPLPQIFLLTAQNNEHCGPVTPLLSGSELGINYQLIKDGFIGLPVQTKAGTGSAGFLVFDAVSDSGTYTIHAINSLTGCARDMQGSIHVDPVIQQFAIYPGGVLCAGVELCIDGSEPGITYQLWLNNQPFGIQVPGSLSGDPICFGSLTNAGIYRIHAKGLLTDCEIFFNESIVINPLPNIYAISPVEGCAGTEILLNSCQDGIAYYLYYEPSKGPITKEAVYAGPVLCAGGTLSFGQLFDEGVYRILAVDTITNCSVWMFGTTIIHPEPEVYSLVPQGSACPPITITLDHFNINATYYLYRNGDTLVATDNAQDGVIDFGIQSQPGIYTVRAQYLFSGGFECWKDMQGSLHIYPEPVKYTLLPLGPLCPPAALFLNGSDAGVIYTLWHNTYGIRQIISGGGGIVHFQPENQPGTYWVTAKTSDSCTTGMYGIITVYPNPAIFNVLPSGQGLCEPSSVGLDGSELNTIYELLNSDGSGLVPPEVHTSSVAGPFWFTNPQPAGSYIVKATNGFGCDTTMNGIAWIHSLPTVDAGPDVDTICNPPSISVFLNGNATNYSSVLWSSPTNPGGSNFSDPTGFSSNYTFTNADILNKKVTLLFTAYGTGICIGSQVTDSIIIHLLAPMVDAGVDQEMCENMPVQLNGNISGGTTSGIWSGGLGAFDDPTDLATIYHPHPSETGTTVVLTLTTTNADPCPDLSDDISVLIYDHLFAGIAGSDQTICYGETPVTLIATLPSGGSSSNFIYQWQISTDGGIIWSDVSSGGNSLAYSPGSLLITTSYRLKQTDTYCSPNQVVYTNNVTITVHEVLSAGTAGTDQIICFGKTPVPLTSTLPSGGSGSSNYTYQWQFSIDGGIIWADVASGGNNLAYSPGSLLVTTSYRLQQADTYCTPDQVVYTNAVTIIVHDVLVAGIAGFDQTICYGETPVSLTSTLPSGGSGITNYTYQWQYSSDGGITWADVASGGNNLIYSPGSLFVTTLFRLQQTDSYCNPDQLVYTNNVTITVHDVLSAGTAGADQSICYGETPVPLTSTLPLGGSGSGNYTHQWQFSTDGGIIWADVASGGNNLAYSPGSLLVTTSYRLQQTDTYCTPDQVVYTNVVTITVHHVLSAGTAGTDQTICYGETPVSITSTLPSGGSGSSYCTYQWQFSTDGGITWADVATGGNNLTYSPGSLLVTTSYRLQQTDTYCTPDQVVYTNVVIITVRDVLSAGTAGTDQAICYGETPVPLLSTLPSGGSSSSNYTYQWQFSTDGGITWADVSSGGNNMTYSPGSLLVTTSYRLQQADTYCTPDQVVYTNAVTIIVHDVLSTGTAGTDQAICYGETAVPLTSTLPLGGSGSGNYTYQWQISTDGGIMWADVASGGNDLTYSPGSLLVTTSYRLQQSDSYCSPNQVVYTNNITITVHDVLSAGTAGTDQTICFGEMPVPLASTLPSGGSGNYMYQWQFSTDGGITWADVASGGNNLAYSPGSLLVTTSYRLQQTDTYCTPDQVVYTNIIIITVQEVLSAGTAGSDQTICYGETPVPLTSTLPLGGSGSNNYMYQWQFSTDGGITWADVASGGNNLTYSPGSLLVTTSYRLLQSDSYCSPNQVVYTNIVTIFVYNQLIAGIANANQAICYGEIPITLNASQPVGGSGSMNFVYQWQSSIDGYTWDDIATGGNSLTYSPGSLTLTTLYRLKQTDTNCTPEQVVYTNTITITVHNILIAGTAGYDQTVCFGVEPVQLSASMPSGGSGSSNFAYQWQFSIDAGLTWANVPAGGTSLTYAPGPMLMTTYYRLVQIDAYCNPDQIVITNTVIVEVQIPTVYAGPDDKVCGLVPYVLEQATDHFADNYTWTTSGSGAFSSQYQLNPTYFPSSADMSAGSVVLTLTISDQCGNVVSDNMTLTLSQIPAAFFTFSAPACSGTSIFFNDLSASGNGYIKQWVWNFGDGSPNDTIIFPGNPNIWKAFSDPATYTVTLTVMNSGGCSDVYTNNVTLLPAPIANYHFYHPCENTAVEFTDASYPNGAGNVISWNWKFDDPGTGINNASTLENPTHIFSQGNHLYNVRLIIVNFNNCSDTIVKQVFIRPAPEVDYTFDKTCLDELVYFTPDTLITNVNAIGSWYWDFGDGTFSNDRNAAHLFAAPGTYTVVLNVTDTAGCPNSISHQVTVNPLPVSHFDAGNLKCASSAVHFDELTSTAFGYIVKWEWDFGDGNTQTVIHPDNPNVDHFYTSPGTYYVTLTIKASDSCTNSETQVLVIHPQPVANFDFVPPACENTAVTFTDLTQNNGGGNIAQWNWNFDDQVTGINNTSTLQNPTHQFSSTGTFNVELISVTNNGCADTVVRSVIIIAKPPVDFTVQNNCQNSEVLFQPNYAVMNPTSIGSWNWSFGDGFSSTLQSPNHTYTTVGTFTVILTVIDTSGCTNTITKPVNIVPQPVSNFDYTQPACRQSAIHFTSLASTGTGFIVSWTWEFGDGSTLIVNNSGNPNVSHTYANYGTFDVSLTVKTNDSCTKIITKPVVVAPNPLANFSYSANCINIPVEFLDLSQSGTGILTEWLWNFGDPSTGTANQSGLQSPSHTYSSAGTIFIVSLIVTNSSGCKDTIVQQVTVNPLPVVDFSYEQGCSGDSTHFNSSTFVNTTNINGWLWNFGDGITSFEIDPVHIYLSAGTFTVNLTITGNDGCTNSKFHTVIISPPPVVLFQASEQRCVNFPVFFDDLSNVTGALFTSWYWDFGDGNDTLVNTPSSPDINHIYLIPGNFTVVLTVTTNQGCEASTSQNIDISASPLAIFEYSNTCVNEPVSFTNQSTINGGTPIVASSWNFGDPTSGTANTSSLTNPLHIYVNAGTYLVMLLVTNSNGCTDTINQNVVINPKPAVDFAWLNTCLETVTQFTVNASVTNINAVQSFDWDFGDGSPHSSLQNPTHVYASADTYSVILTIIDTAGCSNLKSYPIIISPGPSALFSYSSFGCQNTPVQFTDESFVPNGEPIINWHWDFGVTTAANDTSDLQNPGWAYSANGAYYVTLTVTSQTGCQDSIKLPIQVFANPTANFIYTLPNCSAAVDFQDSSYSLQSSIIQWEWEFEPNQYSNLPNPHHVFYATDSCYNVKLTVTDYKGCIATTVKQVCIPSGLSVTFTNTQTCHQDTMYFSPEVLQPEGGILETFNWNFGDPGSGINNTSVSANPGHYYSQTGTYTVILQTSDINHCIAMKYQFVTVDPLPEPVFNYQSGICDTTVYFNDVSTAGIGSPILRWIWNYGDGSADTVNAPVNPDIAHHYSEPGYYNASLTVHNAKDCSATYLQNILVKPCIQANFTTITQQICQNYQISFADSSSGGIPITEREWDFGDGTVVQYYPPGVPSVVTHSFEQPGYYTVKLLVKTAISGTVISDSTKQTFYVKPAPVSEYSADGVCLGNTVQFLNMSSGNGTLISSYKWFFGDPVAVNDSSNLPDPSHTYAIAGDYLPLLIVENTIGCLDTASHTVSVFVLPEARISIENPCIGHPTKFMDKSIQGSSSINNWDWTITDISGVWIIDSIQNTEITFEKTGDFTSQLIVADSNGCADTITKQFTELVGPTSDFSFIEQIDGEKWQISIDNHSKNAVSYEWDFGNGTYSTAENPIAAFNNEGDYLIRLISTNTNTCTDTLYMPYELIYKGLYIPTAFAPEDPKGLNSVFQPKGEGLMSFSIQVFNQWGDVVWFSETENLVDGQPGPGWDGKYRGEYVKMGIYVWVASAVFVDGTVWDGISLGNNTNLSQQVQGTVFVIR